MTQRPYLADEHDELVEVAQALAADRLAAYPRLVEAGKLSREDADDGIRIMAAIAADWRRIVDLSADRPVGERDRSAGDAEKQATLAAAHARTFQRFRAASRALRAVLPPAMVLEVDSGMVDRASLIEAYHTKKLDLAEITVFLSAERRHWALDALLWHARKQFGPMFYAEINAELRARARHAEAA